MYDFYNRPYINGTACLYVFAVWQILNSIDNLHLSKEFLSRLMGGGVITSSQQRWGGGANYKILASKTLG